MKIKFILLSFSIIVLNNTLFSQQPDPLSFFPSEVGNVWEYDTQTNPYRIEILKDSIDEFGNKFLFHYFTNRSDIKIDTSYSVYLIHSSIDTILYHIYKLDADSGSTWIVDTRYNKRARVDNIFQSYIFGELRYVKDIGYYRLPQGDTAITENAEFESDIWLVSGIGEYSEYRAESGPERVLRGAILNGDTLGVITSVRENISEIPMGFKLYQNYPNPFNPTTTIKYEIPITTNVSLKIFNVLGQGITTLVNEIKGPGSYEVNFNGSGFSSGIYIVVLKTTEAQLSRSMLLIK